MLCLIELSINVNFVHEQVEVVFLSSSLTILIFENGQRLTTKSIFTNPPSNFFVSNESYGKINTFLLRCYGIDFTLIQRYHQFCFYGFIWGGTDPPSLISLCFMSVCLISLSCPSIWSLSLVCLSEFFLKKEKELFLRDKKSKLLSSCQQGHHSPQLK